MSEYQEILTGETIVMCTKLHNSMNIFDNIYVDFSESVVLCCHTGKMPHLPHCLAHIASLFAPKLS